MGKIVRRDALGGGGHRDHHNHGGKSGPRVPSLQFQSDESEVWRAHRSLDHYRHRGNFWNTGKDEELKRYIYTALIGVAQACVAYFTNVLSIAFIDRKFESAYDLLDEGRVMWAFCRFVLTNWALPSSPVHAGGSNPSRPDREYPK